MSARKGFVSLRARGDTRTRTAPSNFILSLSLLFSLKGCIRYSPDMGHSWIDERGTSVHIYIHIHPLPLPPPSTLTCTHLVSFSLACSVGYHKRPINNDAVAISNISRALSLNPLVSFVSI